MFGKIVSTVPESFDYDNTYAWYIVVGKIGHEERIAEMIRSYTDLDIDRVFIPSEPRKELKIDGVMVTKNIASYPSYIFVRLKLTSDAWFRIRNTRLVFGFLGSHGNGSKPTPVLDEEMEVFREQLEQEKIVMKVFEAIKLDGTSEVVFGRLNETCQDVARRVPGHYKEVKDATTYSLFEGYSEVDSSNIKSVGYLNNNLLVEYHSGDVYSYHNVPISLYEKLITAESVGRFINSEIKGKYKHELMLKYTKKKPA